MHLVVAEGPLLERIFDLTHPIWHDGLSRDAYGKWNAAQMRLPWARAHFQRFALVDDAGDLLASAKRYRYDVRLDGREGVMCGLGAVFTPPELRGRGHAATLIERLLDQERADGTLFAALFSEIGQAYYERLGFAYIPIDEFTVGVKRKRGAPAMLVRAGDERDLPNITEMHQTRSAGARCALRRDVAALQFAITKKRLFAGLSPSGTRHLEFFVAEEGYSAVAYVVLSSNPFGWTLEEAGDRDPAGARLGAMLQGLVERDPTAGTPIIRTWWPRGFPVPPQLELNARSDAKDLFMVRALADVRLPERTEDVFYWRGDYF